MRLERDPLPLLSSLPAAEERTTTVMLDLGGCMERTKWGQFKHYWRWALHNKKSAFISLMIKVLCCVAQSWCEYRHSVFKCKFVCVCAFIVALYLFCHGILVSIFNAPTALPTSSNDALTGCLIALRILLPMQLQLQLVVIKQQFLCSL